VVLLRARCFFSEQKPLTTKDKGVMTVHIFSAWLLVSLIVVYTGAAEGIIVTALIDGLETQ